MRLDGTWELVQDTPVKALPSITLLLLLLPLPSLAQEPGGEAGAAQLAVAAVGGAEQRLPAPSPEQPPAPQQGEVNPPEVWVTPPASPTRVGIGLYVFSLNHVDPPSNVFPHFTISFLLTVQWYDPRLAFDAEEEGMQRHLYQGEETAEQLREM
jgi:hypothetical protein